ncbi:hypothetical protein ACK3SF_03705 [Candidatus Nanosalina sp. VS9-1]|uniref:hypothetical protein n=1 Tax=Candidatus Nanosalina sp. VS9-1 TaxID=3388566 RepID=UPI0039E102C9
MSDGYELGTAKVFQDFATAFDALKTAEQNVQFSIDPSQGLTRERYGWYSNGNIFDSSYFSSDAGEIGISTGTGSTDTARIRSGYAGQYVSQSLAQPGHAVRIDSGNVNIDGSGLVSLSHGNVKIGPFMHDGSQVTEGFFIEFDSSGTRFVRVRGGTRVTEVDQANWNLDNMTGQGGSANPSGEQLDPSEMYIYNYPFTWYNSGRLSIGRSRTTGIPKPQQIQLWHEFQPSGEPNLNTANLPVQIVFDNAGTGQSLSGALGGMQYSIYGGDGPVEKRVTEAIDNDISISVARNDPIDPAAQPGTPIFAVRRQSGYEDLEVMISDLEVVPSSTDLFFYVWYVWDSSALSGASFNQASTRNFSSETRIEIDKSATSFDATNAINERVFRVSGAKNNEKVSVFPREAESRLPLEATAVVTAVEADTNGNGTTADVVMPIIEGF